MKSLIKFVITVAALYSIMGAILFGLFWQMEITIINTVHGWPFGYFFSIIILDNWVARDILYLCFGIHFVAMQIISAWVGFKLAEESHSK